MADVVRAEAVEVPDEGDVQVVEDVASAHAVVGFDDPHRDADVFQLVVNIIAREVDRVDDVQHPEQVGAAPDDLLLAQAGAEDVAVVEAVVEVDIQFADEVEPVIELGEAQFVGVLVQIAVDTTAAIDITRPHRDAEGDAAAGAVQVLAEHNHALVGVIGQIEGVGQIQTATVGHTGAAAETAGVLQANAAAGSAAVFVAVEVVDPVVAATKYAVPGNVAEDAEFAELAFSVDLHRVAKFRQTGGVTHVGRVLVEAGY